jgi:hypothetical protein
MKSTPQSLSRIQIRIRTRCVVIRLDLVIPAALIVSLAYWLFR